MLTKLGTTIVPAILALSAVSPGGAASAAPRAESVSSTAGTLPPDVSCDPSNLDKVRGRVRAATMKMRIARHSADGATLAQTSDTLERTLAACGPDLAAEICGTECDVERGDTALFDVSMLPLLASKTDGSTSRRDDLLTEARRGMLLVDGALARVQGRQSFAPDSAGNADLFTGYVKDLAQLLTLKARLTMAAGDLWYQAASADRMQALANAVANAIGTAPPSQAKGSELAFASLYYEQAFWALNEAAASVPFDIAFSAEQNTLESIRRELQTRMQSAQEGLLYLGLDLDRNARPSVTSASSEVLWSALQDSVVSLRETENGLDKLVIDWQQKLKDKQLSDFDAASAKSAHTIELEGYKIAQMQTAGEAAAQSVETTIRQFENKQSEFELQQRADAVNAELNRSVNEYRADLARITSETDQDLLGLQKDQLRDQVETLRFQIDTLIAESSFDQQERTLQIQKEQLDTESKSTLKNKIESDTIEVQRLGALIDVERSRIDAANSLLAHAQAARDGMLKQQADSIQREIESATSEKAFYADESTLNKICSAQQTLQTIHIDDANNIKSCLVAGAGSCPGIDATAYQTLVTIKLAQSIKYVTEVANVVAIKAKIGDVKNALEAAKQNVQNARTGAMVAEGLYAAAAGAGAAYVGIAGLPKAFIGLFSAVEEDPAEPAKAIFELAKAAADHAVALVQQNVDRETFNYQVTNDIQQLDIRLAELDSHLTELTNQNTLAQLESARAIAEVVSESLRLQLEVDVATKEALVQVAQCDRDRALTQATAAKLDSYIASLRASLQAKQSEAALTFFDVQEQEHVKEQSTHQIAAIELEQKEIELDRASNEAQRATNEKISAAIDQQITSLKFYWGKVQGALQQIDATKQAIAAVDQKIQSGLLSSLQGQKAYLETAITDAQAAAKQALASLNSEIQLAAKTDQALAQLGAIQSETSAAILASQQKIIDEAKVAPVADPDTMWNFEAVLANFTRGAPEQLETKRKLLEGINFTYNRYRLLYNTLAGMAGEPAIPDTSTGFVQTSDELLDKLAYCVSVRTTSCDPHSLAHAGDDASRGRIVGQTSTMTITPGSVLMDALVERGVARFELSPYAGTVDNSQALGTVFWDGLGMGFGVPLTLLDVGADTTLSSQCKAQSISIRHLGFGMRLTSAPLASGVELIPSTMSVGATAATPLPFSRNDLALREQFVETMQAKDIEARLNQNRDYSFFGYPLIGTYEISVNDQFRQACLSDLKTGANLSIVFAYSYPANARQ